jgi:hypothetical protein
LSSSFVCQHDEYDECSNINRLKQKGSKQFSWKKWTNDDDDSIHLRKIKLVTLKSAAGDDDNEKIKVFILSFVFLLYRLDKYLSFPLQIHLSSFQANENCFLVYIQIKDVLLNSFFPLSLSQLASGRVPPPIYHTNIQQSLESVASLSIHLIFY